MHYSSTVGQVVFAAFDPDNGYAQVGSTLLVVSTYGDSWVRIGYRPQR